MKIGSLLIVGALLAVPTVELAGQSRAQRGAVIGGVVGAGVTGALGALLGRGFCDAADCSDAWLEGAAPGVVFGGLAGAALGALIGSFVPGSASESSPSPSGLRLGVLVDGSTAQAEWNSIDQSVSGARGMIGVRHRGLFVGPSVERLTGGGWRMSSVALAGRLDPASGVIRPFLEGNVGRFSWRNPAYFPVCAPTCTVQPGTLEDAYVGGAAAVGASVGDPRGAWRIHAQVRYHFAPGRPIGEPVSTTTRLLRQVSIGGEIGFRIR